MSGRTLGPIHGLFLVDKPTGITSHDVVAFVRRQLGIRSVGHAGTLDPLASGLMVVLVGEATKLSDYLLTGDKAYRATVQLGTVTDTFDTTGEIQSQNSLEGLELENVKRVAESLSGELDLSVPVYSAVKRDGKKLYEYARQGEAVEVPRRKMVFSQVRCLGGALEALEVEFACSKGSFVRSWAMELGERLGVGGCIAGLRRIRSEPYDVSRAITFQDFEVAARRWRDGQAVEEAFGANYIPMAEALPHLPALTIGDREARLLKHGQIPSDLSRRLIFEQKMANREDRTVSVRVLFGDGRNLLSLIEAQPFKGLKIRRIFNIEPNRQPAPSRLDGAP